jgi:hypothetical protein
MQRTTLPVISGQSQQTPFMPSLVFQISPQRNPLCGSSEKLK